MRTNDALAVTVLSSLLLAVPLVGQETFTRADTLRGTVGPERAWWDVRFYDLAVRVDPSSRSISGSNRIVYDVTGAPAKMQIDLQVPLVLDSVVQGGRRLDVRGEGNAHLVAGAAGEAGGTHELTVFYHGEPRVAPNPPWDGGFIWTRSASGLPWIATANQGLGASVWWPNKDHQSDEPDSMRIAVRTPSEITDVSNGRLVGETVHTDGTSTWEWFVANPINNYNVTINAGDYVRFGETYEGEDGPLDLDYWVLRENLDVARRQFAQTTEMLACFEHWFGPYPFYEDGFKMVETPHLGMEHQSAIAYGNGYQSGYRGTDLSGTGWGLTWDFIIVHEAGHEWFGNNITTADVADMWVHEGFTNYSEALFVECKHGPEAGAEYVIGTRRNIQNDRPVIGTYGVQHEGSGDMYSKGGNLLHTVRQIVNDDVLWRDILRGLNRTFRHSIVTSEDVERYISEQSGVDLSRVWDQYLRHASIPRLQYSLEDGTLRYRWRADVEGFDMPIRVALADGDFQWIRPRASWQTVDVELSGPATFEVDPNFYVEVAAVGG